MIDLSIRNISKYYIPLAKIKVFISSAGNKSCCNQPVKSKQDAYEKLVEMSKNNNYTTGNLLD